MKKIKLFIILISLVFLGTSFTSELHEFYISITSIEYNAKSKKLEISSQYTTHDLEKAIFIKSGQELKLASSKEHPKADSLIFSYINSKLSFSSNKEVAIYYVGKEVNLDETIYVYMESDTISKPKELTITNTVLTEVFNLQSNITHVNFGTKQQTFSFNKKERTHLYKIN